MIIYCLFAKAGSVLGDYGTTSRDFTTDLLALAETSSRAGSRFVQLGDYSAIVMNKAYKGETYTLALVMDSAEDRDLAFDCLDKISQGIDTDRGQKKAKEALVRVPKHMRSAMESVNAKIKNYQRRSKGEETSTNSEELFRRRKSDDLDAKSEELLLGSMDLDSFSPIPRDRLRKAKWVIPVVAGALVGATLIYLAIDRLVLSG